MFFNDETNLEMDLADPCIW